MARGSRFRRTAIITTSDGARIVFSQVESAELFKITLPARTHGDMQIVSVD
jgi:hypothetical protein